MLQKYNKMIILHTHNYPPYLQVIPLPKDMPCSGEIDALITIQIFLIT